MRKLNAEEGWLWYGLRISFWVMIIDFVLLMLINYDYAGDIGGLIALIVIGNIIFCFVTSIVHLVKYKAKGFAITSLVISSIFLLLVLIGAIGEAVGI